ncbi:hypothetical protein [Sulfuricystis multivorans]|uniref:hypothetical protein n=1 Tax=Sulfuricystis multivorans TaxID=2211108 RepID=UPI000F82A6CF|nr:hypothetical protein [Sulfuricystis multivorans]
MRFHTTGAALATAAILAGCAAPFSEAPLATNFPSTKQEKIQAAAHWDIIAKDVASRIASSLPDKRPLHVVRKPGASAFDRAFENLLISSLVANGQTVMKRLDGALNVEVDTQVVSFSANRPQYRHHGTATALATGLWALDAVEATGAGALTAAIVAGDAYSWFRSEFATGETPQTEIIVTTGVNDGNRYLARNTSIYYVADNDKTLYQNLAAQTQKIKVGGGE